MGKRKRENPSYNMSTQEVYDKVKSLKNRADLCLRLYDAVKRVRGKSGHPKCEFLSRLPSKRSNPDYYKVISEPISMVDIEQKLKTGQYDDVGSFVEDMELMFNNARTFYETDSQENTDVELLHEEFSTELRCILKEEADEIGSPQSKRLKLKISHGKVISSSTDKDDAGGSSETGKRSGQSAEQAKEELIVQIKLPDTSTLSMQDESWKPKREKPRKDYAGLFGQRKKLSEEGKEKMVEIYDFIVNEKDEDDLLMCEPFMVKPSIKKYPHYYMVIKRPIDLQEIKEKLDNDKYVSMERFMSDINTLFKNAKFFNEETSLIYEYADKLHKIAKLKCQQLTRQPPPPTSPASSPVPPTGAPPTNEPAAIPKDAPINPNIGAIFDEIKTYSNSDGKPLWETFKSLPNKLMNPDYYAMIKQPIDMVTIATKLLAKEYTDVDKIFNDFATLFDNNCRYYKPHTDQYKDAVTLHKVLVQKRDQLIESRTPNPNVPTIVQGIFKSLLKAVMQYKDPISGRRLSDNIWVGPPPEHRGDDHDDDNDDDSVMSVTDLVTIERRTVKGLYHRLDVLQDDVITLLRHVQSTSTPDNQIYQDSMKLQRVFLRERDRLCCNGKLLWSPAFSQCSLGQLEKQQMAESCALIASGATGVPDVKELDAESDDGGTEDHREYLEFTELSGTSYSVGDTVYVSPKKEDSHLPHIVAIEKLWVNNSSGDHWFSGSWFYRPEETFHVPTRRFIVNEVFCTNRHQMVRMTRVTGKCCVLRYKDYCKHTVEGFDDECIFVCRDRYHIQMKSFKQLKNWGNVGKHWVMVPRQQPMKLDYVYSKFASSELIAKLEGRRSTQPETPTASSGGVGNSEADENEGNGMDEVFSLEMEEFHLEYDNIVSRDQSGVDNGCCCYDQYCLDQYCFRLGDYVYLRSDEQQSYIARIEKMWTDQNDDPWFHGCWFLRPSETLHLPTRTFYPSELLMSNIADTNPMRSVIGKCAVLNYREFCTWRPTEIDEKDVYLCEERYNEHDKDFKKIKGLKKFPLSSKVVVDEVYYFKEEIVPYKEASPHLFAHSSKAEAVTNKVSDSVPMVNVPSVNMGSSNCDNNDQQLPVGIEPITVFALDLQSELRSRGNDMSLANVIQAARNEWSKLSAEQQADYQLRANELSSLLPSPTIAPGSTNLPVNKPPSVTATATPINTRSSYVCHWDGCGMQFADVAGLFAHVTNLGPGSHIKREAISNYFCEWRNCHRHKRCGGKPFNTQAKMLRHLKEVHMGRAIKEKMSYSSSTSQWQSKDCNSTPATPTEPTDLHHKLLPAMLPDVPLASASIPTVSMGTNPVASADTVTTNSINTLPSINAHQQQQQKKNTPLNGNNKQTPQLLHTLVYTRYIEGLRQNKQHASNWSDSQSIRQQGMTCIEPNLCPNTWLSPEAAPNDKNVVDALYQLRDYLLQDAAKLSQYLSNI